MSERGVSAPSLKSWDFTHACQGLPEPWVPAGSGSGESVQVFNGVLVVLSSCCSWPLTAGTRCLKRHGGHHRSNWNHPSRFVRLCPRRSWRQHCLLGGPSAPKHIVSVSCLSSVELGQGPVQQVWVAGSSLSSVGSEDSCPARTGGDRVRCTHSGLVYPG